MEEILKFIEAINNAYEKAGNAVKNLVGFNKELDNISKSNAAKKLSELNNELDKTSSSKAADSLSKINDELAKPGKNKKNSSSEEANNEEKGVLSVIGDIFLNGVTKGLTTLLGLSTIALGAATLFAIRVKTFKGELSEKFKNVSGKEIIATSLDSALDKVIGKFGENLGKLVDKRNAEAQANKDLVQNTQSTAKITANLEGTDPRTQTILNLLADGDTKAAIALLIKQNEEKTLSPESTALLNELLGKDFVEKEINAKINFSEGNKLSDESEEFINRLLSSSGTDLSITLGYLLNKGKVPEELKGTIELLEDKKNSEIRKELALLVTESKKAVSPETSKLLGSVINNEEIEKAVKVRLEEEKGLSEESKAVREFVIRQDEIKKAIKVKLADGGNLLSEEQIAFLKAVSKQEEILAEGQLKILVTALSKDPNFSIGDYKEIIDENNDIATNVSLVVTKLSPKDPKFQKVLDAISGENSAIVVNTEIDVKGNITEIKADTEAKPTIDGLVGTLDINATKDAISKQVEALNALLKNDPLIKIVAEIDIELLKQKIAGISSELETLKTKFGELSGNKSINDGAEIEFRDAPPTPLTPIAPIAPPPSLGSQGEFSSVNNGEISGVQNEGSGGSSRGSTSDGRIVASNRLQRLNAEYQQFLSNYNSIKDLAQPQGGELSRVSVGEEDAGAGALGGVSDGAIDFGALDELKKCLEQVIERLNNASVSSDGLSTSLDTQKAKTGELNQGLAGVKGNVDAYGQSQTNLGNAITASNSKLQQGNQQLQQTGTALNQAGANAQEFGNKAKTANDAFQQEVNESIAAENNLCNVVDKCTKEIEEKNDVVKKGCETNESYGKKLGGNINTMLQFGGAASALIGTFRGMSNGAEESQSKFEKMFNNFLQYGGVVAGLVGSFGDLNEKFEITNKLSALMNSGFAKSTKEIFKTAGAMGKYLIALVTGNAERKAELALLIKGNLQKAKDAIVTGAMSVAKGIYSAATGIATAVTGAFAVALNATGIPAVIAGVALLVGGIYLLIKNFDKVTATVTKMAKIALLPFLAIIKAIGAFMTDGFGAAAAAFKDTINNSFDEANTDKAKEMGKNATKKVAEGMSECEQLLQEQAQKQADIISGADGFLAQSNDKIRKLNADRIKDEKEKADELLAISKDEVRNRYNAEIAKVEALLTGNILTDSALLERINALEKNRDKELEILTNDAAEKTQQKKNEQQQQRNAEAIKNQEDFNARMKKIAGESLEDRKAAALQAITEDEKFLKQQLAVMRKSGKESAEVYDKMAADIEKGVAKMRAEVRDSFTAEAFNKAIADIQAGFERIKNEILSQTQNLTLDGGLTIQAQLKVNAKEQENITQTIDELNKKLDNTSGLKARKKIEDDIIKAQANLYKAKLDEFKLNQQLKDQEAEREKTALLLNKAYTNADGSLNSLGEIEKLLIDQRRLQSEITDIENLKNEKLVNEQEAQDIINNKLVEQKKLYQEIAKARAATVIEQSNSNVDTAVKAKTTNLDNIGSDGKLVPTLEIGIIESEVDRLQSKLRGIELDLIIEDDPQKIAELDAISDAILNQIEKFNGDITTLRLKDIETQKKANDEKINDEKLTFDERAKFVQAQKDLIDKQIALLKAKSEKEGGLNDDDLAKYAEYLDQKEKYAQKEVDIEKQKQAALKKAKEEFANHILDNFAENLGDVLSLDIDLGPLKNAQQEISNILTKIKDDSGNKGALLTAVIGTAISAATEVASNIVGQLMAKTDEEISDIQSQIEERKTLLAEEEEKQKNGYANSVEVQKAAISKLEAAEQKAFKKKQKLAKAQLALDTLTQLSSLAVAAAKMLATEGSKGIPGVIAALAVSAAMIVAFAALKARALKTAEKAGKYEGGYTGDGNPRDASGHFTHKQEYVIPHKPTQKYRKSLLEGIHYGERAKVMEGIAQVMSDYKINADDVIPARPTAVVKPNTAQIVADLKSTNKTIRRVNANTDVEARVAYEKRLLSELEAIRGNTGQTAKNTGSTKAFIKESGYTKLYEERNGNISEMIISYDTDEYKN